MGLLGLLLFGLGLFVLGGWLWCAFLPDGKVMEKTVRIYGVAFGLLLTALGAALPFGEAWRPQSLFSWLAVAALVLLLAVNAGLAGILAAAPVLAPKAAGREKYLLVLGAPVVKDRPTRLLLSRGDGAALWLLRCPDVPAVLCGGRGEGQRTEARVLYEMITARGVSPGRLYCENESATTEENFRFAVQLLRQEGWQEGDFIAVLTSTFHIFRLHFYAARYGLKNIRYVPVPVPFSVLVPWYMREAVLLVRYFFTGK